MWSARPPRADRRGWGASTTETAVGDEAGGPSARDDEAWRAPSCGRARSAPGAASSWRPVDTARCRGPGEGDLAEPFPMHCHGPGWVHYFGDVGNYLLIRRPRSIRGRLTMLGVVCTLLILVPMAVVMSQVISTVVADVAWQETQQQAVLVAAAVRAGVLPRVIKPSVPGVDLVQVVSPSGHVLASSATASSEPMVKLMRPPGGAMENGQTCANPEPGCLRMTALRADGSGSPVVYAARRTTTLTSTTFVNFIVAAQAAVLTVAVGWIAWEVTGRILRPVEAVRSQLAAITLNHLTDRIAEPEGDDEITKLIHTLNQTLLRLERATHEQRRFVADASHELRTPLAGLRLKLEEAQLHPHGRDVDGLLAETLGDVDRLQAIMADLLLLAGLESSASAVREKVDLAELIRTELGRRADRIPVRARLADGVIVEGVSSQLTRVLTNLLDNAQRHARERVEIEVHPDSEQAIMVVCDDGPGIPEADRERVFERFTRLDTARSRGHGGTGLGLALACDIVRSHSGTIAVLDSTYGGARFEVRLPLRPGAADAMK
ncbi:HAMP domain-containing protein [Nonomuraea phyllanthi]|nr:HAMP domain-containing protein [Nonomuraea phyllanthi]